MPGRGATHGAVGAKLRELRTQRGLSVRTLAAQVGFSPSFISQVESDAVSPSIASLEKIASALGITLSQLFSAIEVVPRMVVRHDERVTYASAWSNSIVAVLSDPTADRAMSAVQISVAPGGMSSTALTARAHDTFAYLVAGELTLRTGREQCELCPGDAVYLQAGMPFAWVNHGTVPATLLLVGMAGRADLVHEVIASSGDRVQQEG